MGLGSTLPHFELILQSRPGALRDCTALVSPSPVIPLFTHRAHCVSLETYKKAGSTFEYF